MKSVKGRISSANSKANKMLLLPPNSDRSAVAAMGAHKKSVTSPAMGIASDDVPMRSIMRQMASFVTSMLRLRLATPSTLSSAGTFRGELDGFGVSALVEKSTSLPNCEEAKDRKTAKTPAASSWPMRKLRKFVWSKKRWRQSPDQQSGFHRNTPLQIKQRTGRTGGLSHQQRDVRLCNVEVVFFVLGSFFGMPQSLLSQLPGLEEQVDRDIFDRRIGSRRTIGSSKRQRASSVQQTIQSSWHCAIAGLRWPKLWIQNRNRANDFTNEESLSPNKISRAG
jgi:hypothetical protein